LGILRALTAVVAAACVLGTAGLIDLREDRHEQQAAASEPSADRGHAVRPEPGAERLAAVVAQVEPLAAAAGAARCLAAGPACTPDDLLDVDTTRVRAAEVARAAGPLAAEAGQVADALATWLDDGCGGAIDGVPLHGPVPGRCAAEGSSASAALQHWTTTARRWAPRS
jgi:hypothetical protein